MCGIGAQKLEADIISYTAAIGACEKSQKWQQALQLLHEALARALQANELTFTAAISACEKSASWQKALVLLVQVSEQGLQRDLVLLNAAISACAKAGMWLSNSTASACFLPPLLSAFRSRTRLFKVPWNWSSTQSTSSSRPT